MELEKKNERKSDVADTLAFFAGIFGGFAISFLGLGLMWIGLPFPAQAILAPIYLGLGWLSVLGWVLSGKEVKPIFCPGPDFGLQHPKW